MYTELPHPAIRTAAAHFLQWFYRVHRRFSKAWLVDLRRRRVLVSKHQFNAQRCVRIRTADLLVAIDFELDNIYFSVGDVVLQQTLGISMGGYLSPAMAMMTCMMAERHMLRTLGADARYLGGIRYMDDATIAFRIPSRRHTLLAKLRAAALAAYPAGMVCEVTHEGQSCRMLEQQLFVVGDQIVAVHRNKNAEDFLQLRAPTFTSFLPASSPNGKAYYSGWLKGSLSRILANTSDSQPKAPLALSVFVLFLESMFLWLSCFIVHEGAERLLSQV
jgi:hypothetical protein